MYHSRWKGSHYSAGMRYGGILRKTGAQIPPGNPEYAEKCVTVYEKHYPQILDEIRGTADGMGVDFMIIAQFLLSMYSCTHDNACSCFAFAKNGKVFFGRNSDFSRDIKKLCDSAYYNFDGKYKFIGNTTAWSQIEDGVNECGLAAGLTFVYPTVSAPGLNAGMLVRYALENCANTAEAVQAVRNIPIGSSQNLVFADKSGHIALMECNCKSINVTELFRDGAVYCTNHFTSNPMTSYQTSITDVIYSHKRYDTLKLIFKNDYQPENYFCENLLSGKMGFLCQYKKDDLIDTVWSSYVNLSKPEIYRAEGNPSKSAFKKDKRLKKCE